MIPQGNFDPGEMGMKPMFPSDPAGTQDAKPDPNLLRQKYATMSDDDIVNSEIASTIMSRFESSRTWRRTRRIIWDKCWHHFLGVYDKSNKAAWQSTTFQPATSKVVETVVSNMHAAMMGPIVPIEYQSRRADFDEEVRSTNEIIQSDLDKCDFKAQWTDILRTNAICGTTIGKVDYVKESETVMIKKNAPPSMIDGLLSKLGVKRPTETLTPKFMLTKDNARIKHVDLYDIYPQPRMPEICKEAWIIEKGKITNRELIAGMNDPDEYHRLTNVTEDLLSSSGLRSVDQDPEKQIRRQALLDYAYPSYSLDTDREHELIEYWGLIPLWWLKPELRSDPVKRYESIPGWVWVVDGKWVVRKRVSPWRDAEPPYFKGNYIRVPGEFYGIGVAEVMMGLQIEKNEIRNSRMDNINLMLNKIIGVMKENVYDWNRFKSEPGAMWVFKGIDDIRKAIMPIEFPDITKDSWMASQEVDREIQETTAAARSTNTIGGGQDQAGNGTFRGQLLNNQTASERFMLYARVLEIMGLSKAIKKFYSRIYQFKSFQDAQELLGGERAQKFQFLSPEDLEKVAKLVPLGVMTVENEGVKLAQMEAFENSFKGRPWLKELELARRMWIQMGFPEPDTVLFSDEEQNQYNQARQMMMQSMGASPMGGGMPGQQPQGMGQPPQGLVGPNGQPLSSSGNRPPEIAGNVRRPLYGMPRPAVPARGPGASPIDGQGVPLS